MTLAPSHLTEEQRQVVFSHIKQAIAENAIVLFMKGSVAQPMCGFSAMVVQVLNHYGVPFKDINVLESNDLREGIKEYSDWPTIPQLYVKDEFVGGCDIIREMHQSGELKDLLSRHNLLPHNA